MKTIANNDPYGASVIKEFGAFEAKTHLSSILEKVAAGQSFYIAKRGKRIAEIKPVEPPCLTRKAGSAKHKKSWMAPDFNAPLEDFQPYS